MADYEKTKWQMFYMRQTFVHETANAIVCMTWPPSPRGAFRPTRAAFGQTSR